MACLSCLASSCFPPGWSNLERSIVIDRPSQDQRKSRGYPDIGSDRSYAREIPWLPFCCGITAGVERDDFRYFDDILICPHLVLYTRGPVPKHIRLQPTSINTAGTLAGSTFQRVWGSTEDMLAANNEASEAMQVTNPQPRQSSNELFQTPCDAQRSLLLKTSLAVLRT